MTGLGGQGEMGGAVGQGGAGAQGGLGGDAQGGAAGSGGDALAGAAGMSPGGAAGAGGTTNDPVCGAGMELVGEFATWCGLVNTHTDGLGGWITDSDCTSGCDVNDLNYCQKFWPSSTSIVEVSPSGTKTFFDAGCNLNYNGAGFNQYACCAPAG